MKNLLFIVSLLLSFASTAQLYPQIGARSAALGGTGVTLTDVYSVYNNPGAFGALEETALGVNYENRFLVKELSTQSLAFGFHSENAGNFGVHFQQYGFSLYRELQAGLTYGAKLGDNFYGGLGVNFHRIQLAENYGARTTASASLGLFYEATDELTFGVRAQNISRTKLAEAEDERLPSVFALGVTYQFSEKVFWTIEAEKTIIHSVNIKSGLEIHPHEIFYIRAGVNSFPFQSSFGFGLAFDKFQFDMATIWHSSLGMSPSAGLKYRFN